MSDDEQARFLQGLAEDLNSKEIALPSFPDVVVKIRTALEDPKCSADRLAEVAKTDPVLVSRLLIAANSAFHNRAGIEIVDLNLAISRLGFEVVRNTAIALAVEQIFNAGQYDELRSRLKDLWARSICMSSMSYVLARASGTINADNAFLSGLLNEVGKLYILTKAREYPSFLGNEESLETVLSEWHPQVGRSIVESWGFSADIANSIEADESTVKESVVGVSLADVIIASKILLEDAEEALGSDALHPSISRLNISEDSYPELNEAYELHTQSMRHSIGG